MTDCSACYDTYPCTPDIALKFERIQLIQQDLLDMIFSSNYVIYMAFSFLEKMLLYLFEYLASRCFEIYACIKARISNVHTGIVCRSNL